MTEDHVESRVPTAGEVFSPAVLSLNGQSTNAKLNPERDKILARHLAQRTQRIMETITPFKYGDMGTKQGVVETMRKMRICMGTVDPLYRCDKPGGYAGLPYCKDHAYDALATLKNHKLEEEATERINARKKATESYWVEAREESRVRGFVERNYVRPDATSPGVVYYLLVGKQIKIGWSSNLKQRLAALPPGKLLAAHPGTLDTEKQMHVKFAHLLAARNEWFRDDPALREHITAVVEAHGAPQAPRSKPAPRVAKLANRIR